MRLGSRCEPACQDLADYLSYWYDGRDCEKNLNALPNCGHFAACEHCVLALVRAGGTLVTTTAPPKVQPDNGRAMFFVVEPDRSRVAEVGGTPSWPLPGSA
jgi:hypothetical protein